ncbi:hypothetical protein A9404_11770 [Halothiobacillus diazotrophicus]|uniref:Right handed beta helix domain-containing protein n=1 Tax=Halothiobacillus diazotrophicus TaxID=1860122 RepID=A0A191ZJD9_9GAMM|nr:right-handed parallel beta-helix repeat-containing protein [Halothiobacillus diazotrophicus]ANJ67962.1 hypothetical protein A9404_11770 [Halothiobacillus diazotrophicus]
MSLFFALSVRWRFARGVILAALVLALPTLQGCNSGSESAVSDACMTYWVSPTGSDDTGDGSAAHPFASIQKAQATIRDGGLRGQCKIAVNIAGGVYHLKAPLVFGPGDSGAKGAEIVYQAAPNSTQPVVLSGGLDIHDFQCSGGRCVAQVPDLPAGILPRQFYVDDHRAIRARSNTSSAINPDYGWVAAGYKPVHSVPTLTHPELVEAVSTTQWKMMRCPVARDDGGTLVMAQPCWDNGKTFPAPWNFYQLSWLENAPEFLTDPNMWYLDPYTKTLTYLMASGTPPQTATLPVLESLLQIKGASAAPVAYLQFRNLEFAYATWLQPNSGDGYMSDQSGNRLIGSGYQKNLIGHQPVTYATPGNVSLRYAQHIDFIGNTFKHLGGVALSLDTGSQNNTIRGNRFTDISSSAVQIGGVSAQDARPDAAAANSGNVVENNTIAYTGVDYWDTAGIYVGFAKDTVIAHNAISHVPWSGLAIGWGWGLFDQSGYPGLPHATPGMWGAHATPTIMSNNRIVANRFSHFLEKLWDGGAIYTNGAQGTSMGNGLLIQGNVAESKRPGAGGNIFYTDGGSQFITLTQNVTLNDPTGTVDFGACGYPTSFEGPLLTEDLCLLNWVPYGADMGGCLPVGDLKFSNNYFSDPTTFYAICHNRYDPPKPVNVSIANIGITSAADVPSYILDNAGPQ